VTNPNDQAFPVFVDNGPGDCGVNEGLTKREYFAAMAMQGILGAMRSHLISSSDAKKECAGVARAALFWADALIAELNREKI
jgi:hypothetical protein